MKTCKTCKHWFWKTYHGYTPHEGIVRPLDEDTYQPKEMSFEVKHCNHPELMFCERPLVPDGFCVADGSGYMANLITGSDFGCVKHEE